MTTRWVVVMAAAMLTAMAAGAARADGVSWSAADTAGKPVKVPAEGATSVVVFLRADQPQSKDAEAEVAKLVKDAKGVQVIGIVSGDEADAGAKKIAEETKWSVVADVKYALSGQMMVRVWPTTVVVNAKGEQVAHLAGMSASYARDLGAYLEFAAGKIDKAALDKRLTDGDVVTDSSGQKAERHVLLAQQLANRGEMDMAKAEVAKAAALKPADPKVQVAMARVMLTVGDAKGAEAVVAGIKEGTVNPGEMGLVKGRLALAQGHADEAVKLLTDALKLLPEPAEAWYSLGLAYAEGKNWEKAAEAFRKAYEAQASK